jgi:hypothetical protein
MIQDIQALRDYFHNAGKASKHMAYALLSVRNDLDKFIAAQKTRKFTRTILWTTAALCLITYIISRL